MDIPAGWKLVPVELTEEMNVAGIFAASQMIGAIGVEQLDEKRKEIYRAQLAAAPTPPATEVEPACYGARNFMTKEFAPVLSESRDTIQNWIGDRHQSQDSITYEGPISLYTR